MIKVFVVSLVVAIGLALTGGIHLGGLASAQTTQTITLISGNGPIGTQDPANQFTLDGGVTFQDAFISTHPAYDLIPGTQYISRTPDFSGPTSTATRYRTIFALPSCYRNPSLSVLVHADNVATLFLNGVQIGQQTFAETGANFSDPAESFTVTDPALFQPGANTLEFDIFNFSGPTAFDYKAIVSFDVCDVPIDIKPQSCPNPVDVNDKGVLPVAVLGTSGFDVAEIDVETVKLEGVAPLRSGMEDVAAPFLPFTGKRNASDCTAAGPDGHTDLTLKFDTQAVMAALRAVTDGQARVLKLTGNLKPAFGGGSITGEDVVVMSSGKGERTR